MKRSVALLSIALLIFIGACAKTDFEKDGFPDDSMPVIEDATPEKGVTPDDSVPDTEDAAPEKDVTPDNAISDTENAAMPDIDSGAQGGAELASFFLPTADDYSGRNSLSGIHYWLYDVFDVTSDDTWEWVRESGDYLSTPQTRLTDYPNLYTFFIRFEIPVEPLREALKEQQRRGIEKNTQYYTDEEIEILCSFDEARLLAHFASKFAIVIGDRAYPPAWLYYHSPEDYIKVGITPEMIEAKREMYDKLLLRREVLDAFNAKLDRAVKR